MEDLLPSYAREIEELFSRFATAMKRKGEDITLTNILSGRKPFTEHLFSDNIEDYIYKTVSHKITGGFSTTLGYLIENLSEIILRSAGAEIVKGNPRPYDLKFIHTDGKEYWIELKSIKAQNNSTREKIDRNRKEAIRQGKNFRLCIYNDNTAISVSDTLAWREYWNWIGNSTTTYDRIQKIIADYGRLFTIKNFIQDRAEYLIAEYRLNYVNKLRY